MPTAISPPPEVVEANPPIRLSYSAMGMLYDCGYRYKLHYLDGYQPQPKAALWFGSLVHRVIERSYHGTSLTEAHALSWKQACDPIYAELEAWLPLEQELWRMRGQKPWKKDIDWWRAANPAYAELSDSIKHYQDTTLSHLNFDSRKSLAECFRRSAILRTIAPEEVLLTTAVLVEGRWVRNSPKPSESGSPSGSSGGHAHPEEADGAESEKSDRIALLEAMFGRVKVVGVPDVVAFGDDGLISIVDYKTGMPLAVEELQRDNQLAIYCELLRRNDIIAPNQELRIGHIYLGEGGVTSLWTDTSRHGKVLALFEQQLEEAATRIEQRRFIPATGIHSPYRSACTKCDYRHICDAVQP